MTVSATTMIAVARPSQPTSIGVAPSSYAAWTASLRAAIARASGGRAKTDAALDGAGDPDAAGGDEVGDGEVGRRVRRDGPRDRVLGGVLQGAREAEHLVPVDAFGGHVTDVTAHLAGGDGAGLVEHDRVDGPRGLEHLGPADHDAELGAATGPDEQGRRGREAEGTRARHDEYGDRGRERRRRSRSVAQPEAERGDGQHQHDRHEDPGDPVGQPLHRCLAALGVLDEPGQPRQLGVGTDARRPDDEPAAGVDAGPDDGVAETDLDRDGFAGEQARGRRRCCRSRRRRRWRCARRGGPRSCRPTDRDSIGIRDSDAVAEDGDVLGAEVQQAGQGSARRALGAVLEPAAGEQEGGDAGGGLEVDVARRRCCARWSARRGASSPARRRCRGRGRRPTSRRRPWCRR